MLDTKQEIFNTIELISIFFILLVAIIIITAILYYNRKRIHKIDVANFQNELIKTQLEVQEQTMQTIGADLHDNVGQLLSLTSLTLNSISMDNPDKAQQKIEAAIDLTKQSIKEMRLLGKLLQGDQLIGLGLSEAIRHQINWLEKSGHFQIDYFSYGEVLNASNPNKDLILFRIVQEVLNNIIKHAKATRISIKLNYQQGNLQLNIDDNGVGFEPDGLLVEQKGMGLLNIHKRAAIVGGDVQLVSVPGEGTGVSISIPYP